MNCTSYPKCAAPLCPENLTGVWYPEESICPKTNGWIRQQRKIANKTKSHNTYYTPEMLNRNCIIRSGIKGIDPDKDEEEQIKRWLKNHPSKKEMPEAKKEKLRLKMQSMRASNSPGIA